MLYTGAIHLQRAGHLVREVDVAWCVDEVEHVVVAVVCHIVHPCCLCVCG